MRPLLSVLLLGLAFAGLLFTFGDVLAAPSAVLDRSMNGAPSGNDVVKVLAGGGRIWEGGNVSHPACDITFSGNIQKIGPGDDTTDYRCHWSIHFQDVQGTDLDGAVFTARECRDPSVWRAGGEPDVAMRVVLLGDLNGEPGYSVIMLALDFTEPGGMDQIRFRLFRGEAVIGELDLQNLLYDTDSEFAVYPGIGHRTYLDSGNLQSKVESPGL